MSGSFFFPVVRRVFPSLLAQDIISVQPMAAYHIKNKSGNVLCGADPEESYVVDPPADESVEECENICAMCLAMWKIGQS